MLTVSAFDGDFVVYGNLSITVNDVNDNYPKCSQNVYLLDSYPESVENGTEILNLTDCHDLDSDNFGIFSLSLLNHADHFIISSKVLKTKDLFDYESDVLSSYLLTISLVDNPGSTPQLTSNITVLVNVGFINSMAKYLFFFISFRLNL